MMSAHRTWVLLAVALAIGSGERAGASSMIGSSFLRTASPNGKAILVLDPAARRIRVFVDDGKAGVVKLWEMSGRERVGFVSDDGEYVAVGQSGNELIDDADPQRTLVSFYRRGALVKAVSLGEVAFDPANLPRTVSDVSWGHYLGFVGPRRFAVQTEENRRIVFDVATGLAVPPAPPPRPERFIAPPTKVAPPGARLTTTGQSHGGFPAIAAGPPGFAVAWEEQDPARLPGRHVGVAIVDRDGHTVRGPRIILDHPGSAADLRLIWNGRTFIVIACGAGWPEPGKAAVVWGEIDGQGGFRESGRYATGGFNAAFGCGEPSVEAGGIVVPVIVRDTAYDDGEVERRRRCVLRPLTLGGASASAGRDLPLCHVVAHTPRGIMGQNERDETVILDPKGRSRRAPVTDDLAAVSGSQDQILSLGWAGGSRMDGGFAKKSAFPSPFPSHLSRNSLRAVDADLFAAYGEIPEGIDLAFFSGAGVARWQGPVRLSGATGVLPRSVDCAADAGGIACTYVAGDGGHDDVYFARIRP
jgi:hypothetical protein